MKKPALDELAIPERAILLLEQQEPAHAIHPGVEARSVKAHQRNQSIRLRKRARGVFPEHERKSQRFVAELTPDHAIGLRRAVALIEEQVEHVEHARNALWIEALNLRVLAQPRARPLQSLVNGVFAL